MTILLGAILVAPAGFLLDHLMWYLLVDLEADPHFRQTAVEVERTNDSNSGIDEFSGHSGDVTTKKHRHSKHRFEDQLARKVSLSHRLSTGGKVAPLEQGKNSLSDEVQYFDRMKKNNKKKKKNKKKKNKKVVFMMKIQLI
jgi:hypothetical protein